MRNLLSIGVDQLRRDVTGPDKRVPVEAPHMDRLIAGWHSCFRLTTWARCMIRTPTPTKCTTGPAISLLPKRLARMRAAMMAECARLDDPLCDCVARFNGQWRTGSGRFDATGAYLTPQPWGLP